MYFRKTAYEDGTWIYLNHNRVQWWTLALPVMEILVLPLHTCARVVVITVVHLQ
jgi:hypothetical protein